MNEKAISIFKIHRRFQASRAFRVAFPIAEKNQDPQRRDQRTLWHTVTIFILFRMKRMRSVL